MSYPEFPDSSKTRCKNVMPINQESMENMMNYRTPFGFPVRWKGEDGKHIENEFLFGLYEYFFCNGSSLEKSSQISRLYKYFNEARSLGFPNHILKEVKEKDISHDQITAYNCFAFLYASNWINEDFSSEFKGLKFRGRFYQLSDVIFYHLLAGKWYGYLLSPLLIFFCAWSLFIPYRIIKTHAHGVINFAGLSLVPKLSGELLWCLKAKTLIESSSFSLIGKVLISITKVGARLRFGSVDKMIKKYFNNYKDHPIVENVSNNIFLQVYRLLK